MKFAFVLFGVLIGLIEFFLLKKSVDFITKGEQTFLLLIVAKLIVYAAAICVMLFVFPVYIIPSGIGLAAGMIAGAIINFVIASISSKKGDDTA